MPALFRLFRQNFLPRDVRIVGYARTKMDHDEFLKRAKAEGINIGGSGANAVRLRPMLIFEEKHADILLAALEKIVTSW